MTACLVGMAASAAMVRSASAQEAPMNPILDVGVVQRFGSNPEEEITLKPLAGDSLTVKLQTGDQVQRLTTNGDVKIDIEMQPLPEPRVTERVVLSTHRSFESAEDSALQWRSKGVEVELAQPRQWQVWAKRDTYRTPLLRRLLMQNLQAHGARTAFIDSQVQQQEPQATIVVDGARYQDDEVEFDTANDRIEVTLNREDHGTRLYGGSLKLQPNAYGTYTLVNQVPIETYLRGVVPHEIGLGAPPTTIEAQAILARTYALRNLRRFAIDNYQLCADTQCQVYWGLNGAAPESDRAIAATRGLVLTYQNELVDALYSSTTGGVTAPFSNVWNGVDRPYLQAVVDSVQNIWDLSQQSLDDETNFRAFISRKEGFNEVGWDMFRWRVESPLTDIASDLRRYLQSKQHPLANFTQVKELQILERSPAGRVQRMEVTTDRGIVTLEKDEILRALYAPNSTLFYIDPIYETPRPANPSLTAPAQAAPATPSGSPASPQSSPQASPPTRVLKGYAFVGGGLGHGVGMSQTGAYQLGKLNWSHSRILSFYYPGTQVQPLNPSITFWREPTAPETAIAPAESP
jgi:SpoIID/LytB domain protein